MSMQNRDGEDFDEDLEKEKRKISELFREIKTKGEKEDDKLTWMYKNPAESVNREDYLLGRSVDKALDTASGRDTTQKHPNQLANFPRRGKDEARSQADQAELHRKIHEDPLFAIRQKEIDARKKLLNNPVKMKEVKKMIEAEAKKKMKAERKWRKQQRRIQKDKKINMLLIKELKKHSDKLDFQAMLESDDSSESDDERTVKRKKRKRDVSESSDDSKRRKTEKSSKKSRTKKPVKKKTKKKESSDSESCDKKSKGSKKKKRRVSSSSESSSESDSSESSSDEKDKKRKLKNKGKKTVSRSSRRKVSEGKKKKKQRKLSSSSDSSSESDSSESSVSEKDVKKKGKEKNEERKPSRTRDDEGRKGYDDDNQPKKHKAYGLSTLEGVESNRLEKPVAPYKKKEEEKQKVEARKPMRLSEKEKAAQLKEMMENAKWRKKERESDYLKHKKAKQKEEKIDDFDESFIKNQLAKISGKGSMADRIKSNINNIQRASSSMDNNFVRK